MLAAVAVVLASAVVGVAVNHFSPRGIPLIQRTEAGHVALPEGLREIGLKQTETAVNSRSALLLDARSREEYAAGHLPGALDVPPDQVEEVLPQLSERIEQAPEVIVYCAGQECGDAIAVAEPVAQVAPDRVSIFVGGWRAWSDAQHRDLCWSWVPTRCPWWWAPTRWTARRGWRT